jgi:hypothetical protein
MQPLPLNQRLDHIGQHIVRARLFLDLWFYFEERVSRRKIIETMQKYSEFFIFTPHAYLVAYVIYMAGVFDKNRKNRQSSALGRRGEECRSVKRPRRCGN